MRDYSDGQFEDRAIVASKKQRGKYCIAKVQRINANEVEVLRRCNPMTLGHAKNLLKAGYNTHSVTYLKDTYAVSTSLWCFDKVEAESLLKQVHAGHTIQLLKFDDVEV